MTSILTIERTTICAKPKKESMNIFMLLGGLILLYIFLCMNSKKNLKGGGVLKEKTFILYYVEWCPHCQTVKPEWEKLEKDPELKGIKIDKIDCEKNSKMVEELDIEGFPTILFTNKGKVEPYNGQREYEEFKAFLLSK